MIIAGKKTIVVIFIFICLALAYGQISQYERPSFVIELSEDIKSDGDFIYSEPERLEEDYYENNSVMITLIENKSKYRLFIIPFFIDSTYMTFWKPPKST